MGQRIPFGLPEQAPLNSPLTDFLGQLDSEISTMSEALKSFDFRGPERVELPQLPTPNFTQGLGAILQNIVTPGAAQQFTQQVQDVQRVNAQIGLQQAQMERDSIRNEMARKYGVDFTQFQEMVNLRSELKKEALKAQLGLGGKSELDIRDDWDAAVKAAQGTNGPDYVRRFLSTEDGRALAAYKLKLPESDTEGLANAMLGLYGREEQKAEFRQESLGQGQQRIEISKDSYALNVEKFVDARQATVLQASESVGDLVKFTAEIDAQIAEAKSKVDAQELDKPVMLSTKINGKERYTVRELINLRAATVDMIGGYVTAYPQLAERYRLQGLLGGPSLDIRGGGATVPGAITPQATAPADSVSIEDLKNLIKQR